MKTSKFRHIFALAALCGTLPALHAQNLEESLTVEGKYTPEVISADRRSVSPSVMALSAPESDLGFDLNGVAANFAPDVLSMPATGWRTTHLPDRSRGYIDLRLGSWLNSSLSAGFAAIRNENTELNVRLQHNSTALWQAWKADRKTGGYDADKRFRYDETIGADFLHRFSGAGTLMADLQYHLSYFNYYGTSYGYKTADGKIKAPTQTLNDVYARAAWKGETSTPFSYSLDADMCYFAYRSMYTPKLSATTETGHEFYRFGVPAETTVNIGGEAGYSFSQSSSAGIGIRYSGLVHSSSDTPTPDVNLLRFTPAYVYSKGNINFRAGAELAIVSAGETRFRAAPDIRFSARSGIAAFSARIGGGTQLRSLAWIREMDYYASPDGSGLGYAYSPLDASLAFQLNPGGKWTFGVEGLWRTTLDEVTGGVYQYFLNNPPQIDFNDKYFGYTGTPHTHRLHGFSVGVNAGYEFSRHFGLNGRFNWQPQHGNTGILNGFDRPAITARLSACSNPTDALSLRLDYDLRAKRHLLKGNISRLNLSAAYRINSRLTVSADINNLLNRHEMLLPDLPSEGITLLGGVQVKF